MQISASVDTAVINVVINNFRPAPNPPGLLLKHTWAPRRG